MPELSSKVAVSLPAPDLESDMLSCFYDGIFSLQKRPAAKSYLKTRQTVKGEFDKYFDITHEITRLLFLKSPTDFVKSADFHNERDQEPDVLLFSETEVFITEGGHYTEDFTVLHRKYGKQWTKSRAPKRKNKHEGKLNRNIRFCSSERTENVLAKKRSNIEYHVEKRKANVTERLNSRGLRRCNACCDIVTTSTCKKNNLEEFTINQGNFSGEHALIDVQHREITPEDYELLIRLDDSIPKKTLPKNKFKGIESKKITNTDETDKETCCICMEEFQNYETIKELPNCKHCFHEICIHTWLTTISDKCPLDFKTINL